MSERGPVLRMPLHLRKVPQLTFCFAANPVSLAVTLKIFQLWDQLQPFWSEGGQGFQVRLLLLESRTVLSLPALPTRLAFTCKHQVKFVFIQIISLCYRLTADPIFLTVELGVLWNESKPFRWQGCQGCQVRLFLLESGAILPVLAVKTGFAFTCNCKGTWEHEYAWNQPKTLIQSKHTWFGFWSIAYHSLFSYSIRF